MKKIYLSPPHLEKYEKEYILDALKSNWIAPLGPYVNKFERRLSQYIGVKHCLCVNSGTSAIHLALKVLGVKKNDIVLCQNFTFVGSVSPVTYCNAIPILIGSEEESWNISPEILRKTIIKLIKQKRKPKAIIVVHLYGMPAKMSEIKSIAKRYKIPIIEDAAEALGSSINGKKCGSFGDIGILSFNGNKIITSSGGGAILSNNKNYIKAAKHLATQAKDDFVYYHHSVIGYNYRMSNILAAIGLGQMKSLRKKIETRRKVFEEYYNYFKKNVDIQFLNEYLDTKSKTLVKSNRWLTTLVLNNKKKSITEIVKIMEKQNIEVRPLWKPMSMQPALSSYEYFGNNFEEKLFQKGICLPSGSSLTKSDLNKIQRSIQKVL